MASMVPYDRYNKALRSWPFGGFFDDDFFAPLANVTNSEAFKMNVEETDDSYVVSSYLAGVNRDEIDVELNEGRLSVSVEKKETEEEKGKNYLHKETSEWHASRGIFLKDAATEGITARLDNGVLTVTVPKQVKQDNVTKINID